MHDVNQQMYGHLWLSIALQWLCSRPAWRPAVVTLQWWCRPVLLQWQLLPGQLCHPGLAGGQRRTLCPAVHGSQGRGQLLTCPGADIRCSCGLQSAALSKYW